MCVVGCQCGHSQCWMGGGQDTPKAVGKVEGGNAGGA